MASCRVVPAPKKAAANWRAVSKGGTVYAGFKKKSSAQKYCANKRKKGQSKSRSSSGRRRRR